MNEPSASFPATPILVDVVGLIPVPIKVEATQEHDLDRRGIIERQQAGRICGCFAVPSILGNLNYFRALKYSSKTRVRFSPYAVQCRPCGASLMPAIQLALNS